MTNGEHARYRLLAFTTNPSNVGSMQITVTLSPESHARMIRFLNARWQKVGPVSRFPHIMGVLFVVAVMGTAKLMTGNIVIGLIFSGIAIVWFVAFVRWAQSRTTGYLKQIGRCFWGDTVYETRDDGLHISNDFYAIAMDYSAFTDVIMTPDMLLLMTGPLGAYHLPITEANRAAITAFHQDMQARLVPASPPAAGDHLSGGHT